jgi:hypothetical protein
MAKFTSKTAKPKAPPPMAKQKGKLPERGQVTIDPARLSPEGEFIRFGMGNDELGQGDEITGWIALADLTVEEILAEWDGEKFRIFEPSAERAAA